MEELGDDNFDEDEEFEDLHEAPQPDLVNLSLDNGYDLLLKYVELDNTDAVGYITERLYNLQLNYDQRIRLLQVVIKVNNEEISDITASLIEGRTAESGMEIVNYLTSLETFDQLISYYPNDERVYDTLIKKNRIYDYIKFFMSTEFDGEIGGFYVIDTLTYLIAHQQYKVVEWFKDTYYPESIDYILQLALYRKPPDDEFLKVLKTINLRDIEKHKNLILWLMEGKRSSSLSYIVKNTPSEILQDDAYIDFLEKIKVTLHGDQNDPDITKILKIIIDNHMYTGDKPDYSKILAKLKTRDLNTYRYIDTLYKINKQDLIKMIGVKYYKVVLFFYEKYPNLLTKDQMLYSAAFTGVLQLVEYLVDSGVNIYRIYSEQDGDLYDIAERNGRRLVSTYFKYRGVNGMADRTKPIFYLPSIRDICSNIDTALEDIRDLQVPIIAYRHLELDADGTPIQIPFCIHIDELMDVWFREKTETIDGERVSEMIWRAPTDKQIRVAVPMITDVELIKELEQLLNYLVKSKIYELSKDLIQTTKNFISQKRRIYFKTIDEYETNIKKEFDMMPDGDKEAVEKLLILTFNLGFYMRRWKGENYPLPLAFMQDESDRILFSNAATPMTRLEAERADVINTAKQAKNEVIPLAMASISEAEEDLSHEGKLLFRGLREYDLKQGNEVEYTGDRLTNTFTAIQGDSFSMRDCIQLRNQMLILTAYEHYKIFFNRNIYDEFDINNFRYMHYDNS